MDANEEERKRPSRKKPQVKRKYCLVCHADVTEYLDDLDKIPEGGEYGLWCRECGTFILPMDADELPY